MLSILYTAVVLPLAMYGTLTNPNFAETADPLAAVGALVAVLVGGVSIWFMEMKSGDVRRALHPLADCGFDWVDRFASMDPVSNGPVFDEDINGYEPGLVHNRHAVWSDHTTYWKNVEQFVSSVARAIAPHMGLSLGFGDHEYEEASHRRRRRVRLLVIARTLVAVASLWALWLFGGSGQLGRLGQWASSELSVFTDDDSRVWAAGHDPTVGGALVVLLHVAWYQLVFQAWRWWTRRETRRFFLRADFDTGIWPATVVLALAAAAPVAASVVERVGLEALQTAIALSRAQQNALALNAMFVLSVGLLHGIWHAIEYDRDDRMIGIVIGFVVAYAAVVMPPIGWVASLWPDLFQRIEELPMLDQALASLLLLGPVSLAFALFFGVDKFLLPALTPPHWYRNQRRRLIQWTHSAPTLVKSSTPERACVLSLAANLFAVGCALALHWGWTGRWIVAPLGLAATIAMLMAASTVFQSKDDSWTPLIGKVLVYLAVLPVFVPLLLRGDG